MRIVIASGRMGGVGMVEEYVTHIFKLYVMPVGLVT